MKRRTSRRTILTVLAVVAAVLLVAGIVLFLQAVEETFANITLSDCGWTAVAEVWLDADRDGLRDADEQPVPNVRVHADNVRNSSSKVASAVTDASGAAKLNVFIAGCPETAFEIYVVLPPQFCATTPERLSQAPFTFGIVDCAA